MLIVRTEVKPVEGKGLGLFAAEPILADLAWWVYSPVFDKIMPSAHVNQFRLGSVERDFLEKYGCLEPDGSLYVFMDNARFVNHSENPNSLVKIITAYDAKDKSEILSFKTKIIFASRDIEIGEEITCNYRDICEACKSDLGFVPIKEESNGFG